MTRDVFNYFKHVRSLKEANGAEKAAELGYQHQARGVYLDPRTQKRYKNLGDKLELIPDKEPTQQKGGQPEKKTLGKFKQDTAANQAQQAQPEPTALPQVPGGLSDEEFADAKAKEFTGGRKVSAKRKEYVKKAAVTQVAMMKQPEEPAPEEDEQEPEGLDDLLKDIRGDEPEKKAEDFPTLDDKVAEIEDDDFDITDKYDEITRDYEERVGELTKQQTKKIEALREALGKIDDKDKKKAFGNAITLAYGYTGRVNSGAGKNALGKVDYELLQSNRERLVNSYGDGSPEGIKKFVESTRVIDVSDEEAEIFFDALPKKLKDGFMGSGKISDTYAGHFLGRREDGTDIRGKLSGKTDGVANGRRRGILVAKLLLQQGGKDGYSGADLDLNATDLEHVRGFNNKDDGAPDQTMKDQRENIDNFILTASNLNQTKVDKNMSEWYETEVDRLKDFSDEDYKNRDTLTEQANTINDKAKLVNDLFFNGDELSEDASGELYDLYSKNDRLMAKEINKNINQFGKSKGVKLPNVKNRIGYEMIKKLGLGGYMKKKSGRGNQGKLDDKIYSAFVSTLMDQDAEGRKRLSDVWVEAREMGSQAAYDEQNDGAAKSTLIKHLKKNGGFADRFLEDKEFKRILAESGILDKDGAKTIFENLKKSLRDPF